MPNLPLSDLSLPFGDTITLLMEACGLEEGARAAFDARIRHLQRLGVPDRGGDPQGRLRYGIPELAALATAIRLMDTFMAPALAARYVTERWQSLAPFVLAGAVAALPQSYIARRSISNTTYAVFKANALSMLGKRRQHDERGREPLGEVYICDEALASAVAGAGLVLDSRSYMPIVVHRWVERLFVTEAELVVELDRMRFTT
jgi:hypothetical protein